MNIKKWTLLTLGVITLCILYPVHADDTFVSKDGLYEYELKKEYGSTGIFDAAILRNYFGNEKIVRVPETIDGYQVCYLTKTFSDDYIEKVYLPNSVKKITSICIVSVFQHR